MYVLMYLILVGVMYLLPMYLSLRPRLRDYRARNKGLQILLSNSQAGPGRTVKQEQEEISRNHVQAF